RRFASSTNAVDDTVKRRCRPERIRKAPKKSARLATRKKRFRTSHGKRDRGAGALLPYYGKQHETEDGAKRKATRSRERPRDRYRDGALGEEGTHEDQRTGTPHGRQRPLDSPLRSERPLAGGTLGKQLPRV